MVVGSHRTNAVMMDEPRFAQPIPNVTVAVGRDANLPCVVEHLGAYKVNRFKLRIFSIPSAQINLSTLCG